MTQRRFDDVTAGEPLAPVHKNEDGQAKAAGIEQPINRAVEQILVDVIAGHEQQGKPLQRLDRAIGQYQARQRWRRFSA